MRKHFRAYGLELYTNVSLRYFSTLRTGGMARYQLEIETKEQLDALSTFESRFDLPIYTLGRGTNTLISDKPLEGLVVVIKPKILCRFEEWTSSNQRSADKQMRATYSAGVVLNRALIESQKRLLSGMEFTIGIPGSIGGAVVMNAGTSIGEAKDRLHQVDIFMREGDTFRLRSFDKNSLDMQYRTTDVKSGQIVWEASFILDVVSEARMDKLKQRCQLYLQKRADTQPLEYPNLGSTFKNPSSTDKKAAELIEEAGLKNFTVGGISVSERHANFIVNKEAKGTASDAWKMIRLLQEKVSAAFDVDLIPEVKTLGEFA